MSFETMLNKTCTIQSKTKTQSGSGSPVITWADTYPLVKTRYSPSLQPSADNTLAVAKTYDGVFYFKITQVVTEGNRIFFENEYYSVEGVASDSQGHHREAYVNKIIL